MNATQTLFQSADNSSNAAERILASPTEEKIKLPSDVFATALAAAVENAAVENMLVAYALDLVGRRSEQQLEVKCA